VHRGGLQHRAAGLVEIIAPGGIHPDPDAARHHDASRLGNLSEQPARD